MPSVYFHYIRRQNATAGDGFRQKQPSSFSMHGLEFEKHPTGVPNMQTVAKTTYETFVAFIMPGLIAISPYLYLFYVTKGMPQGIGEMTTVLLLLFLGMVAGSVIDLGAHSLFSNWRWKKKRELYLGESRSSLLCKEVRRRYESSRKLSDTELIDLIDSLFMRYVSQHVLDRRNWEYMLHDSSRNLMIAFLAFLAGLLVLLYSNIISLLFVCIVFIIVPLFTYYSLWNYMSWSVGKIYGFNVSIVIGELLNNQSPDSDHG